MIFTCAAQTCFNTQPPEGGWVSEHPATVAEITVSTHSRPKAAGKTKSAPPLTGTCFNTQPPEGGWCPMSPVSGERYSFNTQPPEGGWPIVYTDGDIVNQFQHTAARRRLVTAIGELGYSLLVSTHSRPKAAGR